jgi:hypothetical protein
MSVCVCLEDINEEPSLQICVFSYPERSGLISEIQNQYVVMWSEKELVNDYTFLKMPINYFFVFVEKLI